MVMEKIKWYSHLRRMEEGKGKTKERTGLICVVFQQLRIRGSPLWTVFHYLFSIILKRIIWKSFKPLDVNMITVLIKSLPSIFFSLFTNTKLSLFKSCKSCQQEIWIKRNFPHYTGKWKSSSLISLNMELACYHCDPKRLIF